MKIAVVSNAASLLGSGLGSTIDEHDIVIRMNFASIEGFSHDVGKKTDIWSLIILGGGGQQILQKAREETPHRKTLSIPNSLWFSRPLNYLHKETKLNQFCELYNISPDSAKYPPEQKFLELINQCQTSWPSTGLTTLMMAMHFFPDAIISAVEFSYVGKHYYNAGGFSHNASEERKIIQRWVAEGKIQQISCLK